MSKRPYSEIASPAEDSAIRVKRSRATDALAQLSENADDLIACLEALKKQDTTDPALMRQLSSLSRKLLPSFQTLSRQEEPAEKTSEAQQTHQTRGRATVPVLTRWSPTEVMRTLPPLPPILDPSLEKAAFTHPGATQNPGERNYEQLEWLGDAYLYLISTAYIFLTFPHLPHGDMCQIREVLVRNMTLKDYSTQYGFEKRAIFPDEYGLNGRKGGTKASTKERSKVLGDIFEAHVAAIILSDPMNGVAKTASWLKALWSTTIPEQIKTRSWQGKAAPSLIAPVMGPTTNQPAVEHPHPENTSKPQKGGAKERLAAELCLHEPRVQIEYRALDEGRPRKKDPLTKMPLFTQGAFLVGYGEEVKLGVGSAQKKAHANELAAQHALDNNKLIGSYRERKKAIQAKRQTAQQEASRGLDF